MKVLNRNGDVAVARPNWSNGVQVDYSFKTSIFVSRDNTESREAMRKNARISIQYLTGLRAEGLQRFMRDLSKDPAGTVELPLRFRSTFLDFAAEAEDDFISVDSVPFWLVPGAHIVLSDDATEEAAVVANVAGGTVTLEDELVSGFPIGSRVMQAYSVRVPQQTQINADLQNFGQANIRYEVDPGSDVQAVPDATPPTFEGRELFLTRPDWAQAPRIDFEAIRDVVDSGRGVIAVSTAALDVTRMIQAQWKGLSKDAAEQLIAFFIRMKGRRTGFFAPAWQEDITITNTAAGASDTLLLDGDEFFEAYSGSQVYNVLIAFFSDGSYQVNRIANVELSGSDSLLTMNDNWDQEVNPAAKVMFCHHMRHATDSLSVQWLTGTVADMQFTFQTVQAGENA